MSICFSCFMDPSAAPTYWPKSIVGDLRFCTDLSSDSIADSNWSLPREFLALGRGWLGSVKGRARNFDRLLLLRHPAPQPSWGDTASLPINPVDRQVSCSGSRHLCHGASTLRLLVGSMPTCQAGSQQVEMSRLQIVLVWSRSLMEEKTQGGGKKYRRK